MEQQDHPSAFTRLINSLLPTAGIKRRNPLFEWQLTRLRWPYFPKRRNSHYFVQAKLARLAQYTLNRGCLWPILFAVIMLALLLAETGWTLILIFAVSFGVIYSLIVNLTYTLTAINAISPQIVTAQWEPLRVTMLTDTDILQANHATIQIQSWRTMMRDVSLRAFIAICGILLLVYSHWTDGSLDMLTVMGILTLGVFAVGCVLEPVWRMRTVTLLAMTLTVWIKNYGLTVLAALAAILTLLLAELIYVLLTSWVIYLFGILLMSPFSAFMNGAVGLIVFPLCAAAIIFLLFQFFAIINDVLDLRLQHLMFRD